VENYCRLAAGPYRQTHQTCLKLGNLELRNSKVAIWVLDRRRAYGVSSNGTGVT
jgi:hypothetical protein